MAASDYDFNLTRTQIIQRAFRIVGVISPGQSLSGNQEEQGRIILNSMVARWQKDHIFLWTQDHVTQALSDGVGSYALPTDPQVLSVDTAFLRRTTGSNTDDTPLDIKSWREYQEEPAKTTSGDPTYICVDLSTTSGTIYTYPIVSDSTAKSLFMLCTVKLKDFDLSTANPDLRSEWLDALSYGLASDLCDEYTLSISERSYITDKAKGYYKTVKKGDKTREDYLSTRGAY